MIRLRKETKKQKQTNEGLNMVQVNTVGQQAMSGQGRKQKQKKYNVNTDNAKAALVMLGTAVCWEFLTGTHNYQSYYIFEFYSFYPFSLFT